MTRNIKGINIFLDGISKKDFKSISGRKISGFTYNPSILSNLGVKNYLKSCKELANMVYPKHISLEVIADDYENIVRQAMILSKLKKNIYVKIPITYTNGKFTTDVIKKLITSNIKINITAIFNIKQVKKIFPIIRKSSTILSVFSGRICDMGDDGVNETKKISDYVKKNRSDCKVLWASTRQVYDIFNAKKAGCSIITMSYSIFKKTKNFNKNWKNYSIETVNQFFNDAKKSKFNF